MGFTRFYTRQFIDTSSNFATLVGSVTNASEPEQEGGTNITITNNAQASIAYTAFNTYPAAQNYVMGGVGINGPPNNTYSLTIQNPGFNFPNGFNTTAYPTLAIQNPTTSTYYGVLTSCGQACVSGDSASTVNPTPGDHGGTFKAASFYATAAAFPGNISVYNVMDETGQTGGKIWSTPGCSGWSAGRGRLDRRHHPAHADWRTYYVRQPVRVFIQYDIGMEWQRSVCQLFSNS